MKLNVVIELKGAALTDEGGQLELVRILQTVATAVAKSHVNWPGGPDLRLYDYNGNKVGRAFVSGK